MRIRSSSALNLIIYTQNTYKYKANKMYIWVENRTLDKIPVVNMIQTWETVIVFHQFY